MAEIAEMRHAGDAGKRMADALVARVAPERLTIIRILARNLRDNGAINSVGMNTLIEMVQAASHPALCDDEATIVVGRVLNGEQPMLPLKAADEVQPRVAMITSDDDLVQRVEARLKISTLQFAVLHTLITSGDEGRSTASTYIEAISNEHAMPRRLVDAFRGLHGLDRLGPPPGHPSYQVEIAGLQIEPIEAWLRSLWQYVPGSAADLGASVERAVVEAHSEEPLAAARQVVFDAFDKAAAEGAGVVEGAHPTPGGHEEPRTADGAPLWPPDAEDAPAAGPTPEPVKHIQPAEPGTIVGNHKVEGNVIQFSDGRIMVVLEAPYSGAQFAGYLA